MTTYNDIINFIQSKFPDNSVNRITAEDSRKAVEAIVDFYVQDGLPYDNFILTLGDYSVGNPAELQIQNLEDGTYDVFYRIGNSSREVVTTTSVSGVMDFVTRELASGDIGELVVIEGIRSHASRLHIKTTDFVELELEVDSIILSYNFKGEDYNLWKFAGWDKQLAVTDANVKATVDDAVNELGDAANLNFIDVSAVTSFELMFFESSFNGDISGWDVSSANNLSYMFANNATFNQDLSGWCVSNVSNHTGFDLDATSWEAQNKPNFNNPPC